MKTLAILGKMTQPLVYDAKGLNRRLTVHGDGMVTVQVTTLRWLLMSRDRKDGRPRQVSFPLWAIRAGDLRTAAWWRRGRLRLDVPAANDPWGKRTEKMRQLHQFPKTKPHKIRFNRRQQPWFVYAAEQIGVDEPTREEA
ncbi:hypothetical protein AB0M47_21125 [Hamadaea sp. NPDC051192]|uniref:hypothetical protein n=1 Tax=Hamadaea sp. NPDC051192 TaxID=3154940 RepID=UPI00342E7371